MTKEQIQNEVYSIWRNCQEGGDVTANIAQWVYDTFVGKKDRANVSDWIAEWSNLWPRGIKSGTRAIRPHPKDVLSKMQLFVKTYGYDKDTVFKATIAYLNDRMDNDFEFTKRAIYFIDKQGEGSLLAEWCDNIMNSDYESPYVERQSYFI